MNPRDSGFFDALLVLGGEDRERWLRCSVALRTYSMSRERGLKPPKLIVSSGVTIWHNGRTTPEAAMMSEFLTTHGAQASDVLIETLAMDTLGNVVLGGDLALRHGCRRVAIVTDDFHLWRSTRLFERVFGAPPAAALGTGDAGTWRKRLREVVSYYRMAVLLAVARVPRNDPMGHKIFLRLGIVA